MVSPNEPYPVSENYKHKARIINRCVSLII